MEDHAAYITASEQGQGIWRGTKALAFPCEFGLAENRYQVLTPIKSVLKNEIASSLPVWMAGIAAYYLTRGMDESCFRTTGSAHALILNQRLPSLTEISFDKQIWLSYVRTSRRPSPSVSMITGFTQVIVEPQPSRGAP